MYASSDDEELMPPCFAIDADENNELDLNAPPTSGHEYLKRVMMEAKQYPKVVVAEVASNKISTGRKHLPSSVLGTGKQPAPKGFAPSLKWQESQEKQFSIVRQNLVTYKARLKKEKIAKKRLPLKEDVSGWCQLCFGDRPTVRHPWMEEDSESSDSEEESETQQEQEQDQEQEHEPKNDGTLPLLSIIVHMDQPTIAKVLEYHVNWFEATGFSIKQGCWFYALLASLEKPLEPEVCSLLRTLVRHCATTRATLASVEDEQLAPLNLLIALISRYFSQADLADNPS